LLFSYSKERKDAWTPLALITTRPAFPLAVFSLLPPSCLPLRFPPFQLVSFVISLRPMMDCFFWFSPFDWQLFSLLPSVSPPFQQGQNLTPSKIPPLDVERCHDLSPCNTVFFLLKVVLLPTLARRYYSARDQHCLEMPSVIKFLLLTGMAHSNIPHFSTPFAIRPLYFSPILFFSSTRDDYPVSFRVVVLFVSTIVPAPLIFLQSNSSHPFWRG